MTDIDDLFSYRLLPRAARQSQLDDLVRYHIEELNMLAERWCARRGEEPGEELGEELRGEPGEKSGDRDEPGSLAESDLLRALRLRTAAGWDSSGFLGGVKRFIDEGRAQGEDTFGAAWLLHVLGAASQAPFDRWLAAVPASVMTMVRELLALTSR